MNSLSFCIIIYLYILYVKYRSFGNIPKNHDAKYIRNKHELLWETLSDMFFVLHTTLTRRCCIKLYISYISMPRPLCTVCETIVWCHKHVYVIHAHIIVTENLCIVIEILKFILFYKKTFVCKILVQFNF